jgi:hypothetical protein
VDPLTLVEFARSYRKREKILTSNSAPMEALIKYSLVSSFPLLLLCRLRTNTFYRWSRLAFVWTTRERGEQESPRLSTNSRYRLLLLLLRFFAQLFTPKTSSLSSLFASLSLPLSLWCNPMLSLSRRIEKRERE